MQKVFIVGQYKSGTAWLLKCLGSHPTVAAINELDLVRAVVGNETEALTPLPHDEVLKNIFGRSAFLNLPRPFIEENGAVYQQPAGELLAALRESRRTSLKDKSMEKRSPMQKFLNCLKASKFSHPAICYQIAFKKMGANHIAPSVSFDQIEDRFLLNAIASIQASDSAEGMMNGFVDGIQPMFEGRNVLLLKGADQVARFDLLEQWAPDAKKIAIVRDGRDASLSAHHYRLLMKERKAGFTSPDATVDFRALLFGWRSRARMLANLRGNPNLKVIRYEDLMSRFEATLSDLFAFIGLKAERELITEIKLRNDFRVVTGRRSGQSEKHVLRSGMCGEWMSALSIKQKEEAWNIAGKELEAFGYRRDGGLNPLTGF